MARVTWKGKTVELAPAAKEELRRIKNRDPRAAWLAFSLLAAFSGSEIVCEPEGQALTYPFWEIAYEPAPQRETEPEQISFFGVADVI